MRSTPLCITLLLLFEWIAPLHAAGQRVEGYGPWRFARRSLPATGQGSGEPPSGKAITPIWMGASAIWIGAAPSRWQLGVTAILKAMSAIWKGEAPISKGRSRSGGRPLIRGDWRKALSRLVSSKRMHYDERRRRA